MPCPAWAPCGPLMCPQLGCEASRVRSQPAGAAVSTRRSSKSHWHLCATVSSPTYALAPGPCKGTDAAQPPRPGHTGTPPARWCRAASPRVAQATAPCPVVRATPCPECITATNSFMMELEAARFCAVWGPSTKSERLSILVTRPWARRVQGKELELMRLQCVFHNFILQLSQLN